MADRLAYDPQDYWDRLHAAGHHESTVGNSALPVAINRAMYAALLDQARRLLADHGLTGPPGRVLDVGAGTGIWVDFWLQAGAKEVVGFDLAATSVAHLRERLPEATFLQADVGAPELPVEGPFDLISAMSVLLHVVDPERWRRALRNLAGVLRPGGHVVAIEPLVVHSYWGPPFDEHSNSRARPLQEWRDGVAQAGLELVDLRPATVLLSNVIDTRSRYAFAALWQGWGLLQQATARDERAGRAAGAVLGALDAPLRRALPHGPSAKLLLLRRPPAG